MSLNRITPPAVKFELHAYGEVYDFSLKSIDNWKDLEFTLKRDETSGVFHQISFPFEFVLDAYDVVKKIFDTYQYRAKADMYIYLLKNNWPYVEKDEQYFDPQIFNLDWTQYNKSDNKIEIDTKRTSLYDFIKAKNKIVYDIPVSDIKEVKQWNFDRIQLENILTEFVSTELSVIINGRNPKGIGFKLGTTYKNSEITVPDIIMEQTVSDGISTNHIATSDDWFLTTGEKFKDTISLNITGELMIPTLKTTRLTDQEFEGVYIGFFKKTPDADLDLSCFLDGVVVVDVGITQYNLRHKFDIRVDFSNDDKLYFLVWAEAKNEAIVYLEMDFRDGFDFEFKVSYSERNAPVHIDLIKPQTLLQSLVDRMTNSMGVYISSIEDFNEDPNNLIMLSASESIRGIMPKFDTSGQLTPGAEIHTSYRNFIEWINTLGYEQHIDGNSLMFRKRIKGFRGDLTAIELGEEECADLREYVNEDYLYSGLKIGYNKKDIENVNGRFEFNGVHDYASDLDLNENILELISPYRADCYGIEFLAQERGKDTTDDKSDKDVFLVNVKESSAYYETFRNSYSGNSPNNKIFNGNLNPFNLMKMNQDKLGISVKSLKFAASDSNSKIIIDGNAINQDYVIPDNVGLFEPIIYDIASRNIMDLPKGENVNGIVRFKYKGNTYEGFIVEISKNPAWESETTWVMYKKSDDYSPNLT